MRTRRNTETLVKGFLKSSTSMLAFLFIIFSSCKHNMEEVGIYGSEYAAAPENFNVQSPLTASTTSADFETSSVAFNASLSDRVTWVITISGNLSGAIKEIHGFSQTIDVTNASWDGNSSNGIFFRAGEACTATLSFLGTAITSAISSPITIVKVKKYSGVLLSDFDGEGLVANGQWYTYSDIENSVKDVDSAGVVSDIPTIQGTSYIHMRGTDQANDWYIGGMGHWYVAFDLASKLAALSADPNEIYMNMYVSSNGTSNTKLGIRINEKSNPQMDVFLKEVPITWSGWKLVSVKLSDFPIYAPDALPGGNGIADQLEKVILIPQPAVAGATCEINVDYIIFTKGAPFQQ